MRIPQFTPFIRTQALQPHTLGKTDLVIDGFNYFFNAYKDSEMPYTFGAESDRFAEHIRAMLRNFQRAHVKCYFIFKSGYNDFPTNLEVTINQHIGRSKAAQFIPGAGSNKVVPPVFMKEIYEEVLDEMGMEYSISVGDFKEDCVALARELSCPILSYDNEYCFFGVPYIPHSGQYFDWNVGDASIQCEIFDLDYFKHRFNLDDEKLAIFIMLVDQNQLGENFLAGFLAFLKKSLRNEYERFQVTLKWLSTISEDEALGKIFAFLDEDGRKKFAKQRELVLRKFINIHPTETITTRFLKDKEAVQFTVNDPDWVQKGIALKHIPMIYINLLRFNRLNGSWVIEDPEEDGLRPSIPIIKYSFDLLTNFQNEGFTFASHGEEELIKDSVRRPDCEENLFGNGWDDLDNLYLFVHFLNESLGGIDIVSLEELSEDVKLLMIALIYLTKKKGQDMSKEVGSVILSYVMLCSDSENNNNITDEDRRAARSVLEGYFELTLIEERVIFNRKFLHPLVEFQHCFQKLNCLNTLCGKPFKPSLYHKTYNATFVYKILYAMKQNGGCCKEFIKDLLVNAPTVLSHFNSIVDVYEKIMEMYE